MNRQASGLKHFDLFIDGKTVEPSGGEYSLDIDPEPKAVWIAIDQ
jgi:hypothetical protein